MCLLSYSRGKSQPLLPRINSLFIILVDENKTAICVLCILLFIEFISAGWFISYININFRSRGENLPFHYALPRNRRRRHAAQVMKTDVHCSASRSHCRQIHQVRLPRTVILHKYEDEPMNVFMILLHPREKYGKLIVNILQNPYQPRM